LPDSLDLEKVDSLGLKLVKNVAENQLGGSVITINKKGKGAEISIRFKIDTV
jgi:two-component sensor histidine kinase